MAETAATRPLDPSALVYVYKRTPMTAFMAAEEGIMTDICAMSKVGSKEYEQHKKTLGTHTYGLAVRNLLEIARDAVNKDFLDQYLAQMKETNGALKGSRFGRTASKAVFDANFTSVPAETLASLSVMLSKETQDAYQDNERFLNTPLPESVANVSEALSGIPLERVMSGKRASNVFTRGRLIRSFGPNFIYDKPAHFSTVLLPVCSPLFDLLCTPGGLLKDQCLPFGTIWVVGEDEWCKDTAPATVPRSPYQLVHKPGIEYLVELPLEDFSVAYSGILKHLGKLAGKHDDVI